MAQIITREDIKILNDILNEQNEVVKKLRSENKPLYGFNINFCGAPELVPLYEEIYKSVEVRNNILALTGIRIFLEEFIKVLWVASEVRTCQLSGKLEDINNDWKKVMKFYDEKYLGIELGKISLENIYKTLKNKSILDDKEIEEIKTIRKCVGNIYAHSKKIMILESLIQTGLITPDIPLGRLDVRTGKVDTVNFRSSHPLVRPFTFRRLAEIIAPFLLKYIFDLTNKKRGYFGPIRGNEK